MNVNINTNNDDNIGKEINSISKLLVENNSTYECRETYSASETYEYGYELGCRAKKGEVYCLNGDLGVGKTVFTQGFAKGLGIEEPINSPTFTIIQEYTEGRLTLYHFDVYRISDISEMDEIGYEEYFYSDGVCLIEWATLIEEIIPESAVHITIAKNLQKGFDYRMIDVCRA